MRKPVEVEFQWNQESENQFDPPRPRRNGLSLLTRVRQEAREVDSSFAAVDRHKSSERRLSREGRLQ
jgi:hypothetical protein